MVTCLLLVSPVFGQNSAVKPNQRLAEVHDYLQTLTEAIKNNSAFSGSLNWAELDKALALRADTMTSITNAPQLANYMLGQLKAVGDKHSFLMTKNTSQGYVQGTLLNEKPQSRLLPGQIGYVSVPALSTTNETASAAFANTIQQMVRELDSQNEIKGWIVDLRKNTGGNMYPMIAGLGPLTGSGKLGYFMKRVNNRPYYLPWHYTKGTSGSGKGISVRVNRPYSLKKKKPKVAILIGKLTSSSGEMTAISFHGAKNTRFFGQPTGGFTTGNGKYSLPDGSFLLLATMHTANRNKKAFDAEIHPDVLVPAGKEGKDAEIEAATTWLLE